ncbi:MAG: 50S ribosomal protein L6 [Bacteroidales bacterium]|nr:50S ribosomal protein L6 [Bacteroidales bacterium]
MSRIGNKPIAIVDGVEVKVNGNEVTVKGAKGTLTKTMHANMKIEVKDNQVIVTRPDDNKENRALHGLTRTLIANMVKGVSEGFKTVQVVIGVGYKAQVQGQVLELSLGYSHNIYFELPPEIKCETVSENGKDPLIIMTSIDTQLLGQVAAKIRSLRKPEPYKGKGIRFQGEVVRKKAGKTAAK